MRKHVNIMPTTQYEQHIGGHNNTTDHGFQGDNDMQIRRIQTYTNQKLQDCKKTLKPIIIS